ncbi:hypothetical protein VPH35_034359 [Triticum aestivum]
MWKLPIFGCTDTKKVLKEVEEVKKEYPDAYVCIIGFDNLRQVVEHACVNSSTGYIYNTGVIIIIYNKRTIVLLLIRKKDSLFGTAMDMSHSIINLGFKRLSIVLNPSNWVWLIEGMKKFETLSYLPPLSIEALLTQVNYLIRSKWVPCLDFSKVLKEVEEVKKEYLDGYVLINGFDNMCQVHCVTFITFSLPTCEESGKA